MRRSRQGRRLASAAALATVALTTTTFSSAAAETHGGGFESSRSKVGYAGTVTLRGTFQERYARPATTGGSATGSRSFATRPAGGRTVRIEYRVQRAKSWRTIARTRTGESGRYRKQVRLKRTGFVRARLADGTATTKRRIVVGSKTKARVADRHVSAARGAKVRGRISPGTAGRRVVVKVGSVKKRTRTRSGGRFSVKVPIRSLGTRKVSVKARGDHAAAGSRAGAGKVTAYRRAFASYYGPGLYGNRTACGGTLTPSTVGVAHKTLPCGTKLTFRHGNRTVRTKVIDRGPFHPGREFDLTEALKQKLGFGSTGYVLVNK